MTTVVLSRVLSAYDLAPPLQLSTLSGHGVTKVSTPSGHFVARRAFHAFEPELYGVVEATLNRRGVHQARLLRTRAGSASVGGWWLREFVAGTVILEPGANLVRDSFAHLALYTSTLATIPVPSALVGLDTVFTRVLDHDWLQANLPGLCERLSPEHRSLIRRGLEIISGLPELPRQLINGDLGPDNVVIMDGSGFSVIDFTPHHRSSLTALAGALYWYCIHPCGAVDRDLLAAAISGWTTQQPMSAIEEQHLGRALVLEAVRRVATPLAVADPVSVSPDPRRIAALAALLDQPALPG